jgi:hypothetical protein
MNLYIFKTNINSSHAIFRLRKVLADRTFIKQWSIDLEDIDKVLKVLVRKDMNELELVSMIENSGIQCEELK